MTMWTLREHGDERERGWWDKVTSKFPNYEVFWREHVVPLTCRVVRSDNIRLRPSVSKHLSELGTTNYEVFEHLASCHEILESSHSLIPKDLSEFYNHLYAVMEAIERFHAATRKVLRQYGGTPPPKSDQRIGSELSRELEELNNRINVYRATHKPPVIMFEGKIPKPDESIAQKYRSPQSVSNLQMSEERTEILDRDFVDARTQCVSDLEHLEGLLNRIWEKVFEELDSMPNVQQYRDSQKNVAEEDREFCNPTLFPPSTNSLTVRRSIATGGSISYSDVEPEEQGSE